MSTQPRFLRPRRPAACSGGQAWDLDSSDPWDRWHPQAAPRKGLSCLQALHCEAGWCCSQSEPCQGTDRLRRKGTDKALWVPPPEGSQLPTDIRGWEGAQSMAGGVGGPEAPCPADQVESGSLQPLTRPSKAPSLGTATMDLGERDGSQRSLLLSPLETDFDLGSPSGRRLRAVPSPGSAPETKELAVPGLGALSRWLWGPQLSLAGHRTQLLTQQDSGVLL